MVAFLKLALPAVFLALTALAPAGAADWVAVVARTGARASVLNLEDGRSRALPGSEYQRKNWDQWSVSRNGREAVRLDAMHNIAIVDVASGRVSGGFSLDDVRGAHRPRLSAELQISHDGRFLLGYWEPVGGEGNPRLVVFDRRGQVLQQDSPYRYRREAHTAAFAWMPDGRAFYLAGRTMAVIDRSGRHSVLGQLELPPGVTTEEADRPAVSPDGRWVALSLRTAMGSGRGRTRNQIYVVPISGGPVRPAAVMDVQARGTSHEVDLMAPVWSPDGEVIAFAPQTGNCHGLRLVRADTRSPVLVDDRGDGPERLASKRRGDAAERLQFGCFVLAWWRD